MGAYPGSANSVDRGVRTLRLTKRRFGVMLGIAGLSVAVLHYAHFFLQIHEHICNTILRWTGLQIVSPELVIIRGIPSVSVPVTGGANPALGRVTIHVLVLGVLVVFGVLQYRFPMIRSLLLFISGLIAVATAATIVRPEFGIRPEDFALLWLRTQVVLWVLLPIIVAILLVPVERSLIRAIVACFVVLGYGILWSAVRLVFCLAIVHETGLAFATALWFLVGPLGDLIYILCFYSLAIRHAGIRLWRGSNALVVGHG